MKSFNFLQADYLEKHSHSIRMILCCFLGLVMWLFLSFISFGDVFIPSPKFTATVFSLLYLIALLPFINVKKFDTLTFLFASGCIACLIYIRVCLLFFRSEDFSCFIDGWVATLGSVSVKEALAMDLGNYNAPYIYILLIISRIKGDVLVMVKAFSCLFDIALAFFAMNIVGAIKNSISLKATTYLLCLVVPTVILNGAYWAQCDAVYAAFALGSIYFVLVKRPYLCVIFWTLAFAFKLQAIFILPALIICTLIGRIKWRAWALAPTVFLASLLPAIISGRGIKSCLSIYTNQAKQYPSLTSNAPSIWQFFSGVFFENFNTLAIFLTGFIVLLLMYLCIIKNKTAPFTNTEIVSLFFAISLLMPLFLPRMHERYFFIADVLSLCVFCLNRKKWYIPVSVIFSSFVAYAYYLMNSLAIIDLKWVCAILLIVLATTVLDLFKNVKASFT